MGCIGEEACDITESYYTSSWTVAGVSMKGMKAEFGTDPDGELTKVYENGRGQEVKGPTIVYGNGEVKK